MPLRPGPIRILRLLLALLALAGVLARGMPPAGATAHATQANLALIAALGGTICHQDSGKTGAPDQPARPHMPDCAVCPICALATAPGAILASGAPLPPRRASSPEVWKPLADAYARPILALLAAPPRGPPDLI